jgi:hypothetical protein
MTWLRMGTYTVALPRLAFTLGLLALMGAVLPATATEYQPGSSPTIDPVDHETVNTVPANRTRATIGVRESVNLSVDVGSWVDKDDVLNDEGSKIGEEDDAIGAIHWWVGCPARGTVTPITGATTVYTAGYAEFNDYESVLVDIDDSGNKGDDYPVYTGASFCIVVPSGVTPVYAVTNPLGEYGPPNLSMGVQTDFAIQVSPTSVNFNGISIREVVLQQTFQCPLTTNYVVPAATNVAPLGSQGTPIGTFHNCFRDVISTGGPWDIANLDTGNGEQSASFSPVQEIQFQIGDTPAAWRTLANNIPHPRYFEAGTYRSQVGWGGGAGIITNGALKSQPIR